MLLAREQHRLERAGPLKGISYYLVKNNIFHWHITLQGLADSAWESGIFQLEMHFDESYSDTPPQVFFLSVPFHPNIDMNSGRPCLAILDATNAWHPLITIQSLLLHLQALLSEPELQDAANPAAAEIFVRAPHLYAQLVRDSVVASRRLASGLPLFDEPPIDFEPARAESLPPLPAERDSNHHRARKTIELSFEAYHRDWKSLATSIPVIPDGSDSPEISKALRQLALGGVSSRDKVTEDQLKETLQRQDRVQCCVWRNDWEVTDAVDMSSLSQKQLGSVASSSSLTNSTRLWTGASSGIERTESRPTTGHHSNWEAEADDLVEWSRDLPDDT
ncbi:hypothetical protein HK105_204858 [Polyrhizophydium stewartii]|uniref:UBC core domain-containing protein n=1 Tax=Polyrhizophydium stewartii TaxID=2732419 RepID=A0ABR4N826_9FUNG